MINKFTIFGLFSVISLKISAQCPCENAYVWLFNDVVSNSVQLEENYSELFEEVLADRSECKILERRNYATLLEHEEMEKDIIDFEDFDSITIKKLTTKLKADIVVLSSIEPDVDSASIVVRVKFVDIFNKELYKSKSISVPVGGLSSNKKIKNIFSNLLYQSCGEENSISKILMFNQEDAAELEIMGKERILLDLDPLTVKWISKGVARNLEVYLENVATLERTENFKVNSLDAEFTFTCLNNDCEYASILSERLPSSVNRVRAVIIDGEQQIISDEFEIHVGIKLLVLGEQPNRITIIPLIDNTSVRTVYFQPELIIFSSENRILFHKKIENPENEYQFKIKKRIIKKIDWDKIVLFPNCYTLGVDDRMIRHFYALDNLKFN